MVTGVFGMLMSEYSGREYTFDNKGGDKSGSKQSDCEM